MSGHATESSHAAALHSDQTLGTMIEVVGLLLAIVGVFLAFQASRQLILGWFPTGSSAKELGKPLMIVESIRWKRNLRTYELRFRIFNSNSSGTSAVSRCIFLEVFAVKPHPLTIDKVFYGAPISQIKGEKDVYNIRAKVGLWELFREPRTFQPNEVEDFHATVRIESGFAYAVRVGIDWHPLDDVAKTKHREVSCFFALCSPAESTSAPSDQDSYVPPISFVNSAVSLASSSDFERITFGDPADDA